MGYDVWGGVKNVASDAWDKTKDTANDVKDKLEDAKEEAERQLLRAKYLAQAEALDSYANNVRKALEDFNQAPQENAKAYNAQAVDWQGKKKEAYDDYQNQLRTVAGEARVDGQNLIIEIEKKAAQLREKAGNLA